MDRYVAVDSFGRYINTILWDGVSSLDLPAGLTAVLESEYVPLENESSPYHYWDQVNNCYTLDSNLLAKIKDEKWEEIKAYRAKRIEGGIYAGNYWFHSDQPSKLQHLGLLNAVMLNALPANLMWKTMSGSFVAMTSTLVQQIFAAALQKEATDFETAETHKAGVYASSDPLNYDYRTGWVPIYGE